MGDNVGQAKRRKLEIDVLKQLGPRIDVTSPDPSAAIEFAKSLSSLLEEAKIRKNFDPVIEILHRKVDASLRDFGDLPIQCKQGCSHCCFIWVSATAPEIFSIAKVITSRGSEAIEKIRIADAETRSFDFESRSNHPYPCPLLQNDLCSIYQKRPKACRLAVSANSAICERSYQNKTDENIPTPAVNLMARSVFSIIFASALKNSDLPYTAYDLNGGLFRALSEPNAEERWLTGEDIFHGVNADPAEIFTNAQARAFLRAAFGL